MSDFQEKKRYGLDAKDRALQDIKHMDEIGNSVIMDRHKMDMDGLSLGSSSFADR